MGWALLASALSLVHFYDLKKKYGQKSLPVIGCSHDLKHNAILTGMFHSLREFKYHDRYLQAAEWNFRVTATPLQQSNIIKIMMMGMI